MRKRYGIQLNEEGDIAVAGGTMSMGDTLAQNEYLLIISQPGDLKEEPLLGAGIADMVAETDPSAMKRRIRDALKADGMDVRTLEMDGGTIKRLEASYR